MTDIYVRCPDRMCFWANAITLEPKACSVYDAFAFTDPLPVPTLELHEWSDQRALFSRRE